MRASLSISMLYFGFSHQSLTISLKEDVCGSVVNFEICTRRPTSKLPELFGCFVGMSFGKTLQSHSLTQDLHKHLRFCCVMSYE